ncbi:ribosome small subunit-dependent GTPase A [Bacillus sp. 2205SS5-2]|uniref:ribosome small subunit-dependent GTPase A n=1 Tax=Bacillus sp. 2205SS5-2 TaxID=3109031 RepID=UPI00300505BC
MNSWKTLIPNEYVEMNQCEETMVGRVIRQAKQAYTVKVDEEEFTCKLPGKFYYENIESENFPVVGDWVLCKREAGDIGLIHSIFQRTSKFSRKKAGDDFTEQIIAVNVDTLFIVTSLNEDVNIRRIERYLMLALESGAEPVILLSKGDLCPSLTQVMAELRALSKTVEMIPVSIYEEWGMEKMLPYLEPGKTIAFVGSSGVGKSTIVNHLLGGSVQQTKNIREKDGKGVHTTTSRELFYLPNGTAVIDTPGMREIQIWEGKQGLSLEFEDIESLAEQCYFRNCSHRNEQGCAITVGIQGGILDAERFQSYQKLLREQEYNKRKSDVRARIEEKKVWKKRSKASRRNRR